MDVLNILDSLTCGVLSCCEMAVDESEERGIDLHEEDDSSFISQTIFETSFDSAPFMPIYSVEKSATDKNKGRYTHKIITGKMYKWFPHILTYIIKMFLDNFLPFWYNILIITNKNIERTEFDHLLKADYNYISFIDGKIK